MENPFLRSPQPRSVLELSFCHWGHTAPGRHALSSTEQPAFGAYVIQLQRAEGPDLLQMLRVHQVMQAELDQT